MKIKKYLSCHHLVFHSLHFFWSPEIRSGPAKWYLIKISHVFQQEKKVKSSTNKCGNPEAKMGAQFGAVGFPLHKP